MHTQTEVTPCHSNGTLPLVPARSYLSSYKSDHESDPFGEKGSIWSFNYFFYNRKLKRILYFR